MEHRQKKRIRRSNLVWTVDSTIALIKMVSKYEDIWDPNNKDYRNRAKNYKTWETIAKALQFPRFEVIIRWSSVRGNYQTYLKKSLETRSDQSSYKAKRPNRIFSELKFLDDIILRNDPKTKEPHMKKVSSPVEATNELSNSESDRVSMVPPIQPNHSRGTQQKHRPNVQASSLQLQRNALTNMTSSICDLLMQSENTDEWDAFGNMIASNARTWASENLGIARRYKAALSAVNAEFELEMAKWTVNDGYCVYDVDSKDHILQENQ